MNYQEVLEFLFAQLPMYQRVGAAAYKTDLKNTVQLCRRLGNPQDRFRSVHIAGTNGKGSVAHMIAAILQRSGLKTGLYTSPHLKDFRERIRINGTMIPEADVVTFVNREKPGLEEIRPSFFEYTVGLAFDHFARHSVDIAVLETGMGGRLDSTNIVTPLLSVITSIGLDHTAFLGNTLDKIAFEKAGIIKRGIPVVIGNDQNEIRQVFMDQASDKGAPLTLATSDYLVKPGQLIPGERPLREFLVEEKNSGRSYTLESELTGLYQSENISAVLASVAQLRTQGFVISDDDVAQGISKVVSMTGIRGRWEVLGTHPLTICDTGHNKDGLSSVVEQIRMTPHRQLHFVFGTVNDKDPQDILGLLPGDATYYFCRADIPRAMDTEQLHSAAGKVGLTGNAFPSVAAALRAAKSSAGPEDLVFVGGSTFVVAEVL